MPTSSTQAPQPGRMAPACLARRVAAVAAANAAAVAALYWNQAVAAAVAREFSQQAALVSIIPFATFTGYAAGVALIAFVPAMLRHVPLRSHLLLLSAALVACGVAPNVVLLGIGSVMVGAGAAVAQRLLAAAAVLVGPASAGRAIGVTIGMALLAVLGVRLLGGALASLVGWRGVLLIAGGLAALPASFGHLAEGEHGPASAPLDRSVLRSSLLRRAAFRQMAAFAAYNAGWLTLLLEATGWQLVSAVGGGGVAGLAMAMLAGRMTDRRSGAGVALAGAAAVLSASGLILPVAYQAQGIAHVSLLVAGMMLLDGGLQCVLVSNQARVQALQPGARAQLAAFVTICGALGGAIGAGAAYWAWHHFGWQAAMAVAATSGLLAVATSLPWPSHRVPNDQADDSRPGMTPALRRKATLLGA